MAGQNGSDSGSTAPGNEHLRASDADRQRVAERLRAALDEGRLSLLEYDERLGKAYAAQTYGELAEVTRDLPASPGPMPAPAESAAAPPAPREPGRAKQYLVRLGRGWLGGAVVMNGIWAATSGFDWHSYWPGIVLPIWAAAIVGGLISGKHEVDDRTRRHDLHQHDRRPE